MMSMVFFLYFEHKKPDQVSNQAGWDSFGHKKGPHLHVRLFVFWIIVFASKSLNRSIVRSRRLHEQGVD
jgi:hypothetical protein